MLKKLGKFYKEPPIAEEIKDEEKVNSMYKHWRLRIFYACFIGYTVFYLCKKNIAVALPGIMNEFGYSATELGLLGSSLYLTYGIGKFVNGVLADGSDVRKFLPTALFMTAFANILFALSPMFVGALGFQDKVSAVILLWVLAFLWGVSGWFQSAGFPAVAKSLTYWYSNSERGTKWSLWSCSHQTGTFLSVLPYMMGSGAGAQNNTFGRLFVSTRNCRSLESCFFGSGYLSYNDSPVVVRKTP